MSNLALIIICFVAGAALRHFGKVPDNGPGTLNAFIIHVSLPAMVLLQIHRLELDTALLFAVLMPWLSFLLAVPFFMLLGKFMGWDRGTIGCLILLGGLGNTSFIGLPMIQAYYGEHMLGVGIVADQIGSFLVLSTLGILTAAIFSQGTKVTFSAVIRRIITFPPAIAVVVALLLRSVEYPMWFVDTLEALGATVAVLAMASVGMFFQFEKLQQDLRGPLLAGLSYRLFLAPLIALVVFVLLIGGRGEILQVTIFEAAMPPMVVGGLIAIQHGLNPRLATLMLALGTLASFITLALWYLVTGWV
ncbi:AEC family transporter [Desulfurispira natronophila]|uniref:AEC family transporter n=1 Tax=Desulfurispira natronophila TaxID=682562 RepID=A0A7W8DHH2_9BACT|nr:AEC family transporter [Desulfurispira natronophila]MBB5022561.1 hypothetical protein [Desulfurispira natronophila]